MNMPARYEEFNGVWAIMAESHFWPNPANIYILPDDRGFALLDLGCGGPAGPEFLKAGLKHFGLDLQKLHTALLTHAHPDHIGALSHVLKHAAPEVMIHRLEIPQFKDPTRLTITFDIDLAVERSRESSEPDKYVDFQLEEFFTIFGCQMSSGGEATALDEGDEIILGGAAFRVIHAPGHSPGHIALYSSEKRLLFPGDLVGPGPAWYNPASGGVTAYLDSLDKIEACPADIMPPSHGPIIARPGEAIARVRSKLLKREAIILDTLARGPKTFGELNQVLFPEPLVRFFPGGGIVESHLRKLEQDGLVHRQDKLVFRT